MKHHIQFNLLTEHQLVDDLLEAKSRLEILLGKKINSISLPGGHYNKNILANIKSGYINIYSSYLFE